MSLYRNVKCKYIKEKDRMLGSLRHIAVPREASGGRVYVRITNYHCNVKKTSIERFFINET
jgi:hypothetical protein